MCHVLCDSKAISILANQFFALEQFILMKDSRNSLLTQFLMSTIHSFGEENEQTEKFDYIQTTCEYSCLGSFFL